MTKRFNEENFWESIERPIIGLAPMHGYTSSDFRLKCRKLGADVVYSEMIASEAIVRNVPKAFEMIGFNEEERPVVIQIFGSDPEVMAQAANIVEDRFSPDGVDINFGCPVQKAAKQGFGAIQLYSPQTSINVVKSVAKALKRTPLSVKMRIVEKDIKATIEFVKLLANAGVGTIAIHARTPTQKYRGNADWNHIYEVKREFPELIILGNGDIRSLDDLKSKIGNLDGALVGRAAKIRPEIFIELQKIKEQV